MKQEDIPILKENIKTRKKTVHRTAHIKTCMGSRNTEERRNLTSVTEYRILIFARV